MRRKFVSRCLIAFVTFYMIGGIYFYSISSTEKEDTIALDYENEYMEQRREFPLAKDIQSVQATRQYNDQQSQDKIQNQSDVLYPDSTNSEQKKLQTVAKSSKNLDINISTHEENVRKSNHISEKNEITQTEIDVPNESEHSTKSEIMHYEHLNQSRVTVEYKRNLMSEQLRKKAREYIRRKFSNKTWSFHERQTHQKENYASIEKTERGFKNLLRSNVNIDHELKLPSGFPSKSLSIENFNNKEIFKGIYIYSAFSDDRSHDRYIRVIFIGPSNKKVQRLWCHFLSNINSLEIYSVQEMTFYETCENHMKENAAYIGSCVIPDDIKDVTNVSLSDSSIMGMKSVFALKIIRNKFTYGFKHKFSICVPPLFGNISIYRLTEFIELSKLLGVEHFVFYTDNTNKRVRQLLHYYTHLGTATVLPWNMTLHTRELWYHGQSAAVWDCLFRTMYVSELVSFNDIDEFLIPQQNKTWTEMLLQIQNSHPGIKRENVAAYRFHSAFFDPSFDTAGTVDVAKSSQLLTSTIVKRTIKFSHIRTKMIVYPPRVFELGIHHLSKPMEEHFRCVTVETKYAILNHYRRCDWNYGMNCDNVQKDEAALQYKNELLKAFKKTLLAINQYT